jgi:hypothetical protein
MDVVSIGSEVNAPLAGIGGRTATVGSPLPDV